MNSVVMHTGHTYINSILYIHRYWTINKKKEGTRVGSDEWLSEEVSRLVIVYRRKENLEPDVEKRRKEQVEDQIESQQLNCNKQHNC
jgi:hypothetical protein